LGSRWKGIRNFGNMTRSIVRDAKKQPYIYMNKDGNPFTISARHLEANVNTREENQNNQNNSNEIKDLMLKRHMLPQIS
jgi:hypothetical protein